MSPGRCGAEGARHPGDGGCDSRAEPGPARPRRRHRPDDRRLAGHGVRRHVVHAAARHRHRAGRGVGGGALLRDRYDAGLRLLALQARQRRLADGGDHRAARRPRRVRGRDVPVQHPRRHGQAVGGGAAAGPRRLRHLAVPGPRWTAPHVPRPALRGVPRAPRRGRRADGRHRRRRLGPGRHHLAAVLGPSGAAQGRRLDRHLGVRRRDRRLARLPARARQPGHRLRLRRGAARRRRDRRPVRGLAGPAPRGPGPRGRRGWADRGHQHRHHRQGAGRLRHRRARGRRRARRGLGHPGRPRGPAGAPLPGARGRADREGETVSA